jgi:F0F1-type ATP synthase assembly protein I
MGIIVNREPKLSPEQRQHMQKKQKDFKKLERKDPQHNIKQKAVKQPQVVVQNQVSQTKKKFEFSKILAVNLIASYYVGVIIGVISVIVDSSNINSLLTYIGGVVGVGLSFFLWKAKAENVVKIKKDSGMDITQIPEDQNFSNIQEF